MFSVLQVLLYTLLLVNRSHQSVWLPGIGEEDLPVVNTERALYKRGVGCPDDIPNELISNNGGLLVSAPNQEPGNSKLIRQKEREFMSAILGPPMYKLQLVTPRRQHTYEAGQEYTFEIIAIGKGKLIGRFLVFVEDSSGCGRGTLSGDPSQALTYNCILISDLLLLHRVTFTWTAHDCNCTNIRAGVIDENGVYISWKNDPMEALSHRVCIQPNATNKYESYEVWTWKPLSGLIDWFNKNDSLLNSDNVSDWITQNQSNGNDSIDWKPLTQFIDWFNKNDSSEPEILTDLKEWFEENEADLIEWFVESESNFVEWYEQNEFKLSESLHKKFWEPLNRLMEWLRHNGSDITLGLSCNPYDVSGNCADPQYKEAEMPEDYTGDIKQWRAERRKKQRNREKPRSSYKEKMWKAHLIRKINSLESHLNNLENLINTTSDARHLTNLTDHIVDEVQELPLLNQNITHIKDISDSDRKNVDNNSDQKNIDHKSSKKERKKHNLKIKGMKFCCDAAMLDIKSKKCENLSPSIVHIAKDKFQLKPVQCRRQYNICCQIQR